jgi:hypothetical protein
MANVYVVRDDGTTEPMTRVHCTSEDRELQSILEKNPDLLPGEQIDPEDPRRWLLIKREMPVPDPATGSERWSIDFLFADQDAIPTFVECKRFLDTRSRREIMGQMLEYAANGYWTGEKMRGFAEDTAGSRGTRLDDELRRLQLAGGESADTFFAKLEDNLRQGQVRLVFFLEEAPIELKSVVDFLNKQTERTEVLLVEARQFSKDGLRVVVPTLFGYTEEARRAKRSVATRSRKKWDRTAFFADAKSRLGDDGVRAMETLLDGATDAGCEISWGKGVEAGSFNIKEPAIRSYSLITARSDGLLSLNFAGIRGSEQDERGRERFKDLLSSHTALRIPEDYARHWPVYPVSDWGSQVRAIVEVLRQLHSEFQPELAPAAKP